jgi:hypothetical protein
VTSIHNLGNLETSIQERLTAGRKTRRAWGAEASGDVGRRVPRPAAAANYPEGMAETICAIVRLYGFNGVDIDYEGVEPDDPDVRGLGRL